ncbi:hypothetical protein GQX74_009714 [Glossina fuscipes]|nr:hypothetical protein GQX74_009714 [Glossina fuscipes]
MVEQLDSLNSKFSIYHALFNSCEYLSFSFRHPGQFFKLPDVSAGQLRPYLLDNSTVVSSALSVDSHDESMHSAVYSGLNGLNVSGVLPSALAKSVDDVMNERDYRLGPITIESLSVSKSESSFANTCTFVTSAGVETLTVSSLTKCTVGCPAKEVLRQTLPGMANNGGAGSISVSKSPRNVDDVSKARIQQFLENKNIELHLPTTNNPSVLLL